MIALFTSFSPPLWWGLFVSVTWTSPTHWFICGSRLNICTDHQTIWFSISFSTVLFHGGAVQPNDSLSLCVSMLSYHFYPSILEKRKNNCTHIYTLYMVYITLRWVRRVMRWLSWSPHHMLMWGAGSCRLTVWWIQCWDKTLPSGLQQQRSTHSETEHGRNCAETQRQWEMIMWSNISDVKVHNYINTALSVLIFVLF